jgi:hypothetical protein
VCDSEQRPDQRNIPLRAESVQVDDKMLGFIADEGRPSGMRWLYMLPSNRACALAIGLSVDLIKDSMRLTGICPILLSANVG